MTVKLSAPQIDDLIDRYLAGVTIHEVASEFGVSSTTVEYWLRARDIPRRGHVKEFVPHLSLPVEDIARRYLAGESVNALADAYGVSRRVIDRRLDYAGVERRGSTEANRLMMEKRSPEENRRNTDAAHEAVRGRELSWEHKCKTAATRQARRLGVSKAETVLAGWLAERGISTVPQQAIGAYNCDLAAGPVAVEVFGGAWHGYDRHAARTPERTRYILDQGWLLAIVWVDGRRYPLLPAAADYLAALVERARRDPSLRGQHRVIWGDGEEVPAADLDVDNIAVVPARGAR